MVWAWRAIRWRSTDRTAGGRFPDSSAPRVGGAARAGESQADNAL